MSDAWLRGTVFLAIVLLVIYQVGAWAHSLFGPVGGLASAAVVAAVSFFAARMAGLRRRSNAWFLAPTLLFTLVPLSANFWKFVTLDKTWWDRAVDFVPFLIGFPAPVLLLLAAYAGLRSRSSA
jgi:hypothetical protein